MEYWKEIFKDMIQEDYYEVKYSGSVVKTKI